MVYNDGAPLPLGEAVIVTEKQAGFIDRAAAKRLTRAAGEACSKEDI